MKTKTFVLSAFALLLASTVLATKLPTMKVTPLEAEKTLVAFESEMPAQFELSVKDNEGTTLYYKKSEKPAGSFQTIFDFEKAGNGNYTVSLNYGNCSLSRNIFVWNEKMEVGEEIRLFAPVYTFENNQLKVSFFNQACKKVFLNVYQNGEYVTGTKLGKEMCIQKAIDFSKLEKGNYDVVLSDHFKDYQFTVSK